MREQYVVCAANRHKETGIVICGARHWDSIMCTVAEALELRGIGRGGEWEQGFIDQYQKYLTREEAAKLVKQNKQELHGELVPEVGIGNCLFSEHLY